MEKLVELLRKRDYAGATEYAQKVLATAPSGWAGQVLREVSARDVDPLRTLLRDVLAEYPRTLLGAPVLVTWHSDRAEVGLPTPDASHKEPSAKLEFVRWLALTEQLPAHVHAAPAVRIPTGSVQCAVALFRTTPDASEAQQHEIPSQWWADLFAETLPSDQVYVSARMLVTYPESMEAAHVLLACARTGIPPVARPGFLTDHAWAWAVDAGLHYRSTTLL